MTPTTATISVVDKAVDGLFYLSAARGGGGVVAASVCVGALKSAGGEKEEEGVRQGHGKE